VRTSIINTSIAQDLIKGIFHVRYNLNKLHRLTERNSRLAHLTTSNAKSDVIFLLGDPDFLLRRRNFAPILLSHRDPHFGLFGVLGGWGYLATSGAKSDVIFLLCDPDFQLGRRNFT